MADLVKRRASAAILPLCWIAASVLSVPASAETLPNQAPDPPARPTPASKDQSEPTKQPAEAPNPTVSAPTPPTVPVSVPDPQICQRALRDAGVRFTVATVPPAPQCGIDNPVTLEAMAADGTTLDWPDRPTIDCDFALVVAAFTRDAVQPLARGTLGIPLTAFGTGPGYECRGRNRVAGAKISAHGAGDAIDIASFTPAGKPAISVKAPGSEIEKRFVAAIRLSACGWFTTVLGPGSDAAHADHLHLDAEARGRDGTSKYCK